MEDWTQFWTIYSPSAEEGILKFVIGRRFEFLGYSIENIPESKRIEISLSKSTIYELLGRESPKNEKDLQSILGILNQLAQWVPIIKGRSPA